MSFNQALIARTIKYFKERCDQDISPEIAEEYLNSMADLYGCFIDCLKVDKKEKEDSTYQAFMADTCFSVVLATEN